MFNNVKPTKEQKEIIEILLREDDNSEIKDGIEAEEIDNEEKENGEEENNEEEEENEKEEKNKINYMDILKHVIPLICILTIHDKETSFIEMFKLIENNEHIYNILIDQTKSWWGNNIDSRIIKKFINVYLKYVKDDKETNQIIRTVKELFNKNINNSNQLSILIDKYLIPQELEKKKNAEISTPHKLRQEMLDKMPKEYWTKPNKTFEPCCGKGGFLIDIVDRFMEGLVEEEKNEKERYKLIVEKCLYFSDINPTNIFICKLLLDPYNDYKLNYNEGNTLELNIKDKWGLEGFDAVIGNPPYTTSQENNSRSSTPLYNQFCDKFIDNCDKLVFVIPSRWFITGKGLERFRKNIQKRKDIESVTHVNNSLEWFGNNVDIKGGCCILYKNAKYNDICKFNGILYDLNSTDKILNPKHIRIINIFKKYKSINEYFIGRYFKIETNDKILDDTGKICCYVSKKQSNNRKKYIKYNLRENDKFWKVISPTAVKGAYSGFNELFILNDCEIHNDSYVSFKVNSKYEAECLKSYLKTKLVNKLLSIRKISQTISKDTIKYIPDIPLNKIWNDNSVYKYFNLTKEEIELIEESI